MNKLPMHIKAFACGNDRVYKQFADFYNHYMKEFQGKEIGSFEEKSFSAKDEQMHKALFSEISRVSGQTKPDSMSWVTFATNPMVNWATFAVIDMMIDAIIPNTIIKNIGQFTELKTVPYGDVAQFNIKPNYIYTVSEGSNARRTTFKTKEFKTSVPLLPVNHTITVDSDLYKVLSGEESLGDYAMKAIISIETEMTGDACNALAALVKDAKFPTQLKHAGVSLKDLVGICQIVETHSRTKPIIMGTALALMDILPDATTGGRIVYNSNDIRIQLVKNVMGYDVMIMPQVADASKPYANKLDDNLIYIIPTGGDKIIKGVLEGGTMAINRKSEDNADLTASQTLNKRWIFEAVSNNTIGALETT